MIRAGVVLALAGCGAPEPVVVVPAADGELVIAQIGLSGAIGDATLVVGPDGSAVLIDVGNDSHADAIIGAVDAIAGTWTLTAVVLTHYHADHIGGFDAVFDGTLDADELIVRGLVDLDGATDRELDEVIANPLWSRRTELCAADPCALPTSLALGEGAELVIYAANGRVWDGNTVRDVGGDLPGDDDGENARSLAGIVRWGSFSYGFAGDLTGGGKGTPDVEGPIAAAIPDELVGADGVDVLHLDHHGIDSSTNAAWIDRMLPDDGAHRDALVGADGGYLDAPADEVLDRLRDRLGGGRVFAPAVGTLVDEDDPLLRVTGHTVIVRVTDSGDTTAIDAP
jgi:hypothetical protein